MKPVAKNIVSIILSLVIIMSSIVLLYHDSINAAELTLGSTVKLGRYDDESIQWIVAGKKDGKALLVSKYVFEEVAFANSSLSGLSGSAAQYKYIGGPLDTAMTNLVYSSFTNSERSIMCSTTIDGFSRKIFALSVSEVNSYLAGKSYISATQLPKYISDPDANNDFTGLLP